MTDRLTKRARDHAELLRRMDKVCDTLWVKIGELDEALDQLLRLVEDGVLVRDTSNDLDPGKFAMQGLRLTGVLKKAATVLNRDYLNEKESD